MCGLLWALEKLAWSPDYLSRVAVILADLASIDPDGSWANRPIGSLVNIFLPWHVQTTAKFDRRKAAIKAVIKNQPKIGWSLLLELLPEGCHTTSGNYRPIWRDFIHQAAHMGPLGLQASGHPLQHILHVMLVIGMFQCSPL